MWGFAPAPIVEHYPEQAKEFMTWEIPFLSQLGNIDNSDYPALKIETGDRDINGIMLSMIDILTSLATPIDHGVYEIMSSPRSRSITVEAEPDSVLIPPPYSSISEPDCTKVRCFVVDYGTKVEVTVMPIINPRYNSDDCQIDRTNSDKCLHRLMNVERADNICRMCIPVFVNRSFLQKNIGTIIEKLQEKGVLVNKYWVEQPHIGRFRP